MRDCVHSSTYLNKRQFQSSFSVKDTRKSKNSPLRNASVRGQFSFWRPAKVRCRRGERTAQAPPTRSKTRSNGRKDEGAESWPIAKDYGKICPKQHEYTRESIFLGVCELKKTSISHSKLYRNPKQKWRKILFKIEI
jgi:hypothetical protein